MGGVVFCDRDGTICKEHYGTYIGSWEMFEFLPGVLEAFRLFADAGFKVFVVSNQAGINKGVITQQQLEEVTKRMLQEVEAAGGHIEDVAYCPHRPEERCGCRKPAPGLLLKLAEKHNIDLSSAWMVGDLAMDVEAGKAAGCKTAVLKTGRPKSQQDWETILALQPDLIAEDLLDAARKIIELEGC